MRATGCCSAQPLLMASWADSGGSAACRLPSGMGWMWANSRPIMNASWGPVASSSRSHKARAPGTEMALGRSSTPGRAKTLLASSSTTSRSGFCSCWVCGLVGVVLGRDPLLLGKTLSFVTYLHLLANQSLVIRTLHENQGVHATVPSAAPQGGSWRERRWQILTTSSLVLLHQPHYGWVQTPVARSYLSAIEV